MTAHDPSLARPNTPVTTYRYDEFDAAFVRERVAEFREQVRRRLEGSLTEDEFRPFRLMNGLYLQLHAYMLRVAIPYGTLTARQMRRLADIADKYDRGYGHFTTRQNLQYNWPKLIDTPDILEALAEVEMHAIQTSGNCIRNVTADHFSGVAPDEIEDPRATAEFLRQWSSAHPEFSFLPRKFKIAVTGSEHDRAAIMVHDVGLRIMTNAAGDVGYQVVVGGGLGRTPFVGKVLRDYLPRADLLAYLEAVMRVYNRFGRRDNKYKARIKILVHEKGIEEVRAAIEAEFVAMDRGVFSYDPTEFERIAAFFTPPPYEALPAESAKLRAERVAHPAFGNFVEVNAAPHRVPGYAIVTVSLKPIGGIPGDATSQQMRVLAEASERFGFGELRISHEQNVILPHVKQDDLFDLWKLLDGAGLATANAGLVSDIISCPGLDYCALATARSIPIAQAISKRFSDLSRQRRIGKLGIKISGCINACGHHHVGAIGILGLEKKGQESYQITLGGDPTFSASIGEILGPGVTAEQVPDVIEHIVDFYLAERQEGETFIETWRRIGHARFKDVLRREGEDGADI
ncbi:nitrite/sulfite reductase [Methylocystis sp. MJC1]|jgi:sulfite reductase (NADPH) hemoprotein beta-component|uniref:nitrite/sulfite reductase n=1 Tax=Methylocystis sp. MJC1 TaxID=2654282 RepID=UPI0013EC87E2|nr:nitrite/sulfite reductase [Methylocystis sp. MJC1]KAF2990574.1 Sulfite reductase [ferredoxin] [Methylocystis sp. MJC1]MBU6525765.1 nitrite/sulfite reductase [Methylocystis sp. MJC1]UZX12232.1 nitrite/sulfite reductase [Methylocystis sp. MJC1]